MVLVQVWQLIGPELGIRPYPPSVDFVSVSQDDTGFFGDDKLLYFISFGDAGQIHFFEHEDILFRLDSLLESLFLDLTFLVVLFVFGLIFALVIVSIFGLVLVRVIIIRGVVVIVFRALLVCVHS